MLVIKNIGMSTRMRSSFQIILDFFFRCMVWRMLANISVHILATIVTEEYRNLNAIREARPKTIQIVTITTAANDKMNPIAMLTSMLWHSELPSSEVRPDGQGVQVSASGIGANLPAGHGSHLLAPLLEYDPAKHVMQTDSLVACVDWEYFPAVHNVHDDMPSFDA